ncbi:DUF1266 domain-containing protein [Microbacteriaceae bacterium VKM Ac-2854]|nr:DUF1266 domain-containing protein [Microbacteriaceae bacterium VKM Ac-2854]
MGLFDKLKKMMSFSFNMQEGAPPLSPEQERGLAVGAIYAAEGHLPINALSMGADARTAAKLLKGAWGVHGPADVPETYAYLFDAGHRGLYELAVPYAMELLAASRSEQRSLGRRNVEEVPRRATELGLDPDRAMTAYLNWSGTYSFGMHNDLVDPLPASILAWDMARVVHLSRLLLDAGFVSPEDAWAAVHRASETARAGYGSWQEFGDAFVVGRAFWSSITNRDHAGDETGDFVKAVKELQEQPESPWVRLAW